MRQRPVRWTPEELVLLQSGKAISSEPPINLEEKERINWFGQRCVEIRTLHHVDFHFNPDDLESGFSCHVQAWFFREKPEWKSGIGYEGLNVSFSALAPYFCLQQGARFWSRWSGGSFTESWDDLDLFPHPEVAELVPKVQAHLESHGLVRLYKQDLADPLADGLVIQTCLRHPPHNQWDALFFWMD
ncbi:hypothetical protein JST97_26610 [bacterium]|nr:hypothetical protein [bacterium]